MTPARYRKKPVVIEARQLPATASPAEAHAIVIATLEGGHWVTPGDWVIRGVQGEFYPCKSDVFEATYERVAADDMSEPTTEVGLR